MSGGQTSYQNSRIRAIVESEEAKGREGLADHLAYKTGLTAKEAIEALQASPALNEVDQEVNRIKATWAKHDGKEA